MDEQARIGHDVMRTTMWEKGGMRYYSKREECNWYKGSNPKFWVREDYSVQQIVLELSFSYSE